MKVIIAGSTDITDYELVKKAIKLSKFKIKEVVSGTALGVDKLGEKYADENGIPIKRFPAEWNNLNLPNAELRTRYNKWKKCDEQYVFNAGFIRNGQMVDYADALIALPGSGGGTKDTITKAKKKGIPIYVHEEAKVEEADKEYEYDF